MSESEDQMISLARTRVVLARMAGEQERLRAAADSRGLSFCARMDWLMDRWSSDEVLAWHRHWSALGVNDPEPRDRPAWHGFGIVPLAPRRRPQRTIPPVIPPTRQLEIAMSVLDRKDMAA